MSRIVRVPDPLSPSWVGDLPLRQPPPVGWRDRPRLSGSTHVSEEHNFSSAQLPMTASRQGSNRSVVNTPAFEFASHRLSSFVSGMDQISAGR